MPARRSRRCCSSLAAASMFLAFASPCISCCMARPKSVPLSGTLSGISLTPRPSKELRAAISQHGVDAAPSRPRLLGGATKRTTRALPVHVDKGEKLRGPPPAHRRPAAGSSRWCAAYLGAPPRPARKLGVSRPNSVRVGVSQSPFDRSPPHCSLALRQVYQGGEVTGGRRVYIGNINYDTREDEIKADFSEVQLPWPALACARAAISCRTPCTLSPRRLTDCTSACAIGGRHPLAPPPPALAPATGGFSTWISCGRGSLA